MKHTKGPWTIDVIDGEQVCILEKTSCEQGYRTIAIVTDKENDFDAGPKNISLIATAPEMLEALEMLLNSEAVSSYVAATSEGKKWISLVVPLIKKAKGDL